MNLLWLVNCTNTICKLRKTFRPAWIGVLSHKAQPTGGLCPQRYFEKRPFQPSSRKSILHTGGEDGEWNVLFTWVRNTSSVLGWRSTELQAVRQTANKPFPRGWPGQPTLSPESWHCGALSGSHFHFCDWDQRACKITYVSPCSCHPADLFCTPISLPASSIPRKGEKQSFPSITLKFSGSPASQTPAPPTVRRKS